jgi:hypothetical protein
LKLVTIVAGASLSWLVITNLPTALSYLPRMVSLLWSSVQAIPGAITAARSYTHRLARATSSGWEAGKRNFRASYFQPSLEDLGLSEEWQEYTLDIDDADLESESDSDGETDDGIEEAIPKTAATSSEEDFVDLAHEDLSDEYLGNYVEPVHVHEGDFDFQAAIERLATGNIHAA